MDKLKALYDAIPAFECIPGCTDCCGPVPFSKSEWAAISDKRKAVGIGCPYANGGCDIYEQRPFLCRLFGAGNHPFLTCPHGCGPEKKLSRVKARNLTDKYEKMIGG